MTTPTLIQSVGGNCDGGFDPVGILEPPSAVHHEPIELMNAVAYSLYNNTNPLQRLKEVGDNKATSTLKKFASEREEVLMTGLLARSLGSGPRPPTPKFTMPLLDTSLWMSDHGRKHLGYVGSKGDWCLSTCFVERCLVPKYQLEHRIDVPLRGSGRDHAPGVLVKDTRNMKTADEDVLS